MMIHERVKDERRKAGRSGQWLADCLGIDASTLHRMESGEIAIGEQRIQAICRLLGITLWRLYGDDPVVILHPPSARGRKRQPTQPSQEEANSNG